MRACADTRLAVKPLVGRSSHAFRTLSSVLRGRTPQTKGGKSNVRLSENRPSSLIFALASATVGKRANAGTRVKTEASSSGSQIVPQPQERFFPEPLMAQHARSPGPNPPRECPPASPRPVPHDRWKARHDAPAGATSSVPRPAGWLDCTNAR